MNCSARPLILGTVLAALAATPLAARPHNGLGEFLPIMDALGYDPLTWPDYVVNNASALPFSALGTLPVLTSFREVDMLFRQLGQPHRPLAEGEIRPPWETYGWAQWNTGDFDEAPQRPMYNPETFGGLLGVQHWVDEERLIGATASYNFARAKLHDNGNGGRIDNDQFRLRLYAMLRPEEQPWWLIFGASGGYNSYDTRRVDFLDGGKRAKADPLGYEVGVFAGLNARFELTEKLALTPFARFDYNIVHTSKFREEGTEYSLHVYRFDTESYQTRLGSGLEYADNWGGLPVNFGFSAAWISELAGNNTPIRSEFNNLSGSKNKIKGDLLFGDAFEFSPSVSVTLDNGIMLQAAYSVLITLEGQFMQNASASIGYRF